jgi:hypothetical protein
VLDVLDGCGGAQLACDDNSGLGSSSSIAISLTVGQTAIVVVDGPGGGEQVL